MMACTNMESYQDLIDTKTKQNKTKTQKKKPILYSKAFFLTESTFNFFILYWRIVDLQGCVSFRYIAK